MWKFTLLLLVATSACAFRLRVLHINDFHARFEQTNKRSSSCSAEDAAEEKCFGGVARLYEAVRQIREEDENVIFLNGGDMYQGTVWYTIFKSEPVIPFMNKMNFTASSLGNHEFDDSPSELLPLAKRANFPLLCANCDFSKAPKLAKFIKPSTVVSVQGTKVGIISYLTPKTKDLADLGKVTLSDEIIAVRKQVKKLRREDVNIIIALGHSGYEKDKEVAENVAHLDLVIGGHSHSFLYPKNEEPPSIENPIGEYPTMVTNKKTYREVPVVQAYAFTKYLGNLELEFNEQGRQTSISGKPILLDKNYPENEDILKSLEKWQEKLAVFTNKKVAETRVELAYGLEQETNFGDFVCDGMLAYYNQHYSWSSAYDVRYTVAVYQSGGIRSAIPAGDISLATVLEIFPFGGTIDSFVINVRGLKEALEYGASGLGKPNSWDWKKMLQVAGMEYTIDLSRTEFDRITSIKFNLPNQPTPVAPANDDEWVRVITNDFIGGGGYGFDMFAKDKTKEYYSPGLVDVDFLQWQLAEKTPIGINEYVSPANRITIN